MDSLGGGGSSGGTVVQQTAPWAAYAAGNIGQAAANRANALATADINTAIDQLNSSYRSAAQTLQPYTQNGIQALDQLNQYLGLNPYQATAPVQPTVDSEANKITEAQIDNYINSNVTPVSTMNRANGHYSYNPNGQLNYIYNGQGAFDDYINHRQDIKGDPASGGTAGDYGTLQGLYTQQNNAARNALANQQLAQDLPQYNADLANYNQDQQWAQQYGTPLTSAQIAANISSQPGFQAQLQQGTQTIQNSASAKGYLGSGNILEALNQFGQNQLSQYYGDTLSRLGGLAASGQSSAGQLSTEKTNQGTSLASLQQSLASDQANSILAAAKSQSDAMTAANQQFNEVGGGGGGGLGGLLGGVGSVLGLGTGGGNTIGGSIFNAL